MVKAYNLQIDRHIDRQTLKMKLSRLLDRKVSTTIFKVKFKIRASKAFTLLYSFVGEVSPSSSKKYYLGLIKQGLEKYIMKLPTKIGNFYLSLNFNCLLVHFFNFYLFSRKCGCATGCMLRSVYNFQEKFLTLHHMNSKDQTQVLRLGGKCL